MGQRPHPWPTVQDALPAHLGERLTQGAIGGAVVLHFFREDVHWNAERQAVEFGVEIGEYRGVVRVPRRVFQRLLPERPTPERCVEAYYLQRTRFESIAERKLRRRQLTEEGTWRSAGGTCASAPTHSVPQHGALTTITVTNGPQQPGRHVGTI